MLKTQKEIRNKMREFTAGDFRRKQLQAELDLLEGQSNGIYKLIGTIIAVCTLIIAIAGLVINSK